MDRSGQINFYLMIILGTLVIFMLSTFIISFLYSYQGKVHRHQQEMNELALSHQEELLYANFQAIEEERLRISGDFHDELGSVFSTLSLTIDALLRRQTSQSDIRHIVQSSQQLIGDGLKSMRNILNDIVPPDIRTFGLGTIIMALCDRISASGELSIWFEENGIPLSCFSTREELALYRIVQELISNTLKHARAKEARVIFDWDSERLSVYYSDDGIGFRQDQPFNKGIGLKNISSRAKMLGSESIVHSATGAGMSFTLQLNISARP